MSRLVRLRRDFDEFRRRRPDAVTVPMSVDALAALLAVAEAGLAVDDDWRSINWPTSEHYEALATAIAPLLADGTDREPTPDVSKPAHDESSIACDVVCGTSSETVPDAHEAALAWGCRWRGPSGEWTLAKGDADIIDRYFADTLSSETPIVSASDTEAASGDSDAHDEDVLCVRESMQFFDDYQGQWIDRLDGPPAFDRILARLEAEKKRAQVAEAERDWLASTVHHQDGVTWAWTVIHVEPWERAMRLAAAREAVERGE